MFRVKPCIDNQANRSRDVALETAVVAVGVLIEPQIFAELFREETPALGVRGVLSMLAKLWNASQLLRNGKLQMMTRHTFVISKRFRVSELNISNVKSIDHDSAGALSIGRTRFVSRRRPLPFRIGVCRCSTCLFV
jgi:hypothetical protein